MSDHASADANELAKFGYKQELERKTGKFASFAVAFAFVSIATGIFTTFGAVLNSSGPMGIWTWPIATIGQLAVAFLLGALAARIPVTGYHYQWFSRLANPVMGCTPPACSTSSAAWAWSVSSAAAMARCSQV